MQKVKRKVTKYYILHPQQKLDRSINVTIEELLGEQSFSKGDTKTIMEEIEKYITSTKHGL